MTTLDQIKTLSLAVEYAVERIAALEKKRRAGRNTIVRAYAFEAAHALTHLPPAHKCHALHGHSYVIEVAVTAELDGCGMVMDFADLDTVVAPLIERLDHSNLNDQFDFFTTSENLARWLFFEVSKSTPTGIEIDWVSASETRRSKAIYARDVG